MNILIYALVTGLCLHEYRRNKDATFGLLFMAYLLLVVKEIMHYAAQ
jgi:hypothetical protein